MIKKCLFAIVCLFTASCASQKLEIKPINHVSTFLSHQALDTLELVGDEIWLRKKGKLVATYKSIKKQDMFESAVEEVKSGYAMMKDKGATEILYDDSKYGFFAETDKFKTYYIADKNNKDYWALISLKSELVGSSFLIPAE